MTKTMVILKEAPFLFAAFAAIQYHHKLPSSGSRILATLPLAVGQSTVSFFFYRGGGGGRRWSDGFANLCRRLFTGFILGFFGKILLLHTYKITQSRRTKS